MLSELLNSTSLFKSGNKQDWVNSAVQPNEEREFSSVFFGL